VSRLSLVEKPTFDWVSSGIIPLMYTLGKQARALFFLYALAFAIISTAPFFVSAETMEERRLRLESELAVIEQDIVEKRGVLSEKQAERTSLERDMAIQPNSNRRARDTISRYHALEDSRRNNR